MTARIQILLVDDHLIARVGLRSLLETQSDLAVVAEASSGDAACRQFDQSRPDIVLMDLRMPGLSGVETIQQIRAKHPHARVIVLTTFDNDEDIYRALQAGASGFL